MPSGFEEYNVVSLSCGLDIFYVEKGATFLHMAS